MKTENRMFTKKKITTDTKTEKQILKMTKTVKPKTLMPSPPPPLPLSYVMRRRSFWSLRAKNAACFAAVCI